MDKTQLPEVDLHNEIHEEQGVTKEEEPIDTPLGLALSGGGVRAALFSLGVIIGLIHTKCHQRVRCIASVSGGSILNAVLAHAQSLEKFKTIKDFEALASPLATELSKEGVFAFEYKSILLFIWHLFKLLGNLALKSAVVVIVAISYLSYELPPEWWALLDKFNVPWHLFGWILAAITIAALVWKRGLLQEVKYSSLMGVASDRSSDSSTNNPYQTRYVKDWCKRPSESGHALMHVLVSTDLLSGSPMYFSGAFVYCQPYGWGEPGDLRTAEIIYSSAAFPVVFPPKKYQRKK